MYKMKIVGASILLLTLLFAPLMVAYGADTYSYSSSSYSATTTVQPVDWDNHYYYRHHRYHRPYYRDYDDYGYYRSYPYYRYRYYYGSRIVAMSFCEPRSCRLQLSS